MSEVTTDERAIEGVASGVLFLAIPPEHGANPDSATVVAWHLLDPPAPRPLRRGIAVGGPRCMEGLPRSPHVRVAQAGRRRCGATPTRVRGRSSTSKGRSPIKQPGSSVPHAEVAGQLGLGSGPVGLLGGSAGAAVALLVLAEQDVDITAAVLVSPLVRLRSLVEAMDRHFGVEYSWSDRSREVATRLDFVERAGEIAERRQDPAVLLVVGEDDDVDGIRRPAEELRDALADPAVRQACPRRLELIPGMGHQLANPRR